MQQCISLGIFENYLMEKDLPHSHMESNSTSMGYRLSSNSTSINYVFFLTKNVCICTLHKLFFETGCGISTLLSSY